MTKIKISDEESYLIEIPDELDRIKLEYVVNRLSFIQKMMAKDPLSGLTNLNADRKISSKKGKNNDRDFLARLKNDRQLVIDLYKAYYDADKSAFPSLVKSLGKEEYFENKYRMSSAQIRKIRNAHQITPEDLGLDKFSRR